MQNVEIENGARRAPNGMEEAIASFLHNLNLGEPQTYKNMSVFPLLSAGLNGPEYILLKDALDKKVVTITEVSQAGTVPQLKVANSSPSPVLLIDGEELIGAKQNRILNTSILMEGNSEIIVPVSCTERGRWSYRSNSFSHSEVIMGHRSRASKSHSVTDSLLAGKGHSSDQRRVWADIEAFHRMAGTTSPTGAMHDVYTAKAEELNEYLAAFPPKPDQAGCLAIVNGEPAGMDALSRGSAYEVAHPILMKSHAIEAIIQQKGSFAEPSEGKAQAFLDEFLACEGSAFSSVGDGIDVRFDGERVTGSALVVEGNVLHLSFFRLDPIERKDEASSRGDGTT
jgi:hypothetical protein